MNPSEMTKKIKARFPSNIALVKYWGKYGQQLPCNASLSLTLKNAYTSIEMEYKPKSNPDLDFKYFFEGKENIAFKDKVVKYAQAQAEFSEFLRNNAVIIHSSNSFPHSTGIASSAAAFATIAAVLLKAAQGDTDENKFLQTASHLARLGSGSACRSFYGPYALWGRLENLPESSNEYAIPILDIHENFADMRDAIVIVEDQPKQVSSTVGHSLMKNHPYAAARFEDANKHCEEMLEVLKYGNFESFISITEREALSLHAMMMTSGDYYMLMKPGTIQVIEAVMQFRKSTGLPVCFTLDAGPNVHILYPAAIQDEVKALLDKDISPLAKSIIMDEAGCGGQFL